MHSYNFVFLIFIHVVFSHILLRLKIFLLNSGFIFNILYISHDFHNNTKQFFPIFCFYISILIFTRSKRIRNNDLMGFGIQLLTDVYGNCIFTYLGFFIVHTWRSIRDQGFHEEVNGLKCWTTP